MLTINPSATAVRFHEQEVTRIFEKLLTNKFVVRGKNKERKYLHFSFLKFLKVHYQELVSGKPNELLQLHEKYESLPLSCDHRKLIKSFFIDTGYGNFNNQEFLEKLNIDTCVYCNRNYTVQLVKDRARAQLDHWFPKESHPLLALSFYNLIPSCQSCNHIKLNKAPECGWHKALENIFHPYEEELIFSFSYDYNTRITDPSVKFIDTDSKAETSLKYSRLKEIYDSSSKRELKDLLDLRYKYSDNYLKILFEDTFNLSISEREISRFLFGVESKKEDYHKRPFSKFKKDIIEELLRIG
ncbi:hypothetical protein [Kaistella sp.]|uniref:hypothetical protein n=1 Tax=Kaistella sp. TaxID=2782235 RepID=UPI003C3435E3